MIHAKSVLHSPLSTGGDGNNHVKTVVTGGKNKNHSTIAVGTKSAQKNKSCITNPI